MGWQAAAVLALMLIAAPNLVLALLHLISSSMAGAAGPKDRPGDESIAAAMMLMQASRNQNMFFGKGDRFGSCATTVIDLQAEQPQRGSCYDLSTQPPVLRMRKVGFSPLLFSWHISHQFCVCRLRTTSSRWT
jgi:hypothetical protein